MALRAKPVPPETVARFEQDVEIPPDVEPMTRR